MKFTKEQAYKELVAKMTARGEKLALSERTINGQLDTLIQFIANDETELDDFIGKVLPSFQNLEGQYRKDNSDFIKQWEQDHPVVKPNANPEPKDNKDDDYTKKLEERLAALEAKNAEAEKKTRISNKKAELLSAMKSKGIKDEDWAKTFIAEINVTEDMDIEAKAESFLKIYNKSKASYDGGGTPRSADGKPQNYTSLFDDIKKDREAKFEKEKGMI